MTETLNPQKRDIYITTQFLIKRGFNVTRVEPDEYGVEAIQPGGYLVCGDGRKMFDPITGEMLDNTPTGPSIFGGFDGFRALLGHGDKKGANKALDLLDQEELLATIHGDELEQGDGCGARKKVRAGQLRLPHRLELADPLKDPGLSSHIKYVIAMLKHLENKFVICLEEGFSTKRALDGSTFRYDPRILNKNGVSLTASLNFGISTVKTLSPCREAILVAAY